MKTSYVAIIAVKSVKRGMVCRSLRMARQQPFELTRAHQLEPNSISPMINLAELWFYARRFDREETELGVILDRDPESVVARAMLASVENLTRRGEEAIEEMKRLLALPEGGYRCSALAKICAQEGQPRASFRQAKECGSGPISASTFFARGQNERGMEALETDYSRHDEIMVFLNVDPGFDLVRDNPDFQRLLRKVGFWAISCQLRVRSSVIRNRDGNEDRLNRTAVHYPAPVRRLI
jgi:hypothetical protein